ncbi:MAG: AAA family ATPase [Thermosynechococcaceae cyanobacterium MS004]|nr:AAA family ATPase [Thermosynechococcaceae cyanobacterium MS004]
MQHSPSSKEIQTLIQTLIQSFHPILVIETVEEERVQGLLQAATQAMALPMFEWSRTKGLTRSPGTFDAPWTNEYAPPGTIKPTTIGNTAESLAVLQHIESMTLKAVFWLKDFTQNLEDPAIARQLRELAQKFSLTRSAIVLTGNLVPLPQDIAHDAVYVDFPLPTRDELTQSVKDIIRTFTAKYRIQVELQPEEMKTLVHALSGMTLKQARQVLAYAALGDLKLTAADIKQVLHRKAQVIRNDGVLEYLPTLENTAELGGFNGLKRWLTRAEVGFSAQARALNLSAPKGILIVGIQGCGKSLAAKAIARAWNMPLLKLDAGRLYNKYIGESESNFRQAIRLAESMAPSVLWIDEIEKSFSGTQNETDGGLSQRLFGFFLTWMQEKTQEVFVVATANDISQIPSEFLRKGRFDEVFFVDLPLKTERETILNIHLKKHRQDPDLLDLAALVDATDGFSGAELEQVVITGLYSALYLEKPLDTDLLLKEISQMIPLSVSRKEHLEDLRAIAQDRFVSVH